MHAEPTASDDGSTLGEADSARNEARFDASPRVVHNIMDVLYPAATPPEPKNARVIRLFDVEGAKNDPLPASNHNAKAQQDRKNREDVRALRNRSLLAAAGLA